MFSSEQCVGTVRLERFVELFRQPLLTRPLAIRCNLTDLKAQGIRDCLVLLQLVMQAGKRDFEDAVLGVECFYEQCVLLGRLLRI